MNFIEKLWNSLIAKTNFCDRPHKTFTFSTVCVTIILMLTNCSNLDETFDGSLAGDDAERAAAANLDKLFLNLDNSLRDAFQNPWGVFALCEVSTNELIVPTRGSDWDDNGIWRQLHQHRWDANQEHVVNVFNSLNGIVYAATNILQFGPGAEQSARARFFRAFAMYWLLDLYDKVPYREPGESTLLPAKVRVGMEAWNYIIAELNTIMNDLEDLPVTRPTKNAARVLLMKCYLNKFIYENRPFESDPPFADMDSVIRFADDVINSNQYTFSKNYFDNFAPDNGNLGKENIFTMENEGGLNRNSGLFYYTQSALHYNSTPFGFNGFVAVPTLYDAFESGDKRRGQFYEYRGGPPNPGQRINVGLLIGQQYNLFNDDSLEVVAHTPLVFTPDVTIVESGPDLRSSGIRPVKYAYDFDNWFALDNDWVYFRLPDVLLMKAEAILRGGAATDSGPYGSTALDLVNSIRTHPSRNASKLSNLDLDVLLEERYRELWFECWRRQDMIRFRTFLEDFYEKKTLSDPWRVVYPIPNQQLVVNPDNLQQNPGY